MSVPSIGSRVAGKQLRSKLRGVMSDRVMRITRECSKQQHQQQQQQQQHQQQQHQQVAKVDLDKSVKIQRLLSGSFSLTPPVDEKKKKPTFTTSPPKDSNKSFN